MGTLNAVYVRANGASIEAAVRKIFPTATIEAGQGFTGFILANDTFEPPHDDLCNLSEEFGTDVIWLSFQSVVDAFQFHHWHEGSLLRSLVYGCYGDEERTWNQVDGDPETWEGAALFDPEGLKISLKYVQSDDEKRELERIWQEEELVPDRNEPIIDARETARKVARFYDLPGWS
jgi:hypothetical protein